MKIALGIILFGVSAVAEDTNSRAPYLFRTKDGRCAIAIDTSAAPELADRVEHKLAPVLAVWYPKIVALLPGAGFTGPRAYSIIVQKWTVWSIPPAQTCSSSKNEFKAK